MTNEILHDFNFIPSQFYEMLFSYKDKINTIAELRSLWIEEENKFAKVLRILSAIYLRKYSLNHIFNSRV